MEVGQTLLKYGVLYINYTMIVNGVTRGAMADDIYYLSWENTKLKGESKGFLMSANVKGTIKDDNDFKDLMGNWLTEKYKQFEWVS